jgi:hypothetical protein
MAQHVINTHATPKSPSPGLPVPAHQYARRGRPRKASQASPALKAERALARISSPTTAKKMRPETRGRQVVPTDQILMGEEPH